MSAAGVTTAAVGAPPRRARPRAFGLDVLRVLAALGVLVTHVAFASGVVNPQRWSSSLRLVLPRLDVGVSVFFVLSGLLVTRPFLRRVLDAAPVPPVGPYAVRRLSRIFPLYWVVLAVTLITVGPRPPLGRLLADVLLVHIYRPAWAIGPITQSWSLSTELAFYAFVPAWFALCRWWFTRRGIDGADRRARWLAGGLVLWVLVALAWRLGVVAATDTFDYTAPGGIDTRGALLTWLPNHLDTFAVGCGLALWLESGRARPLAWAPRLACYGVGLGALWVASAHLDLPPVFTGFDGGQTLARHALFVVCAALLVVPSAAALARPVGDAADAEGAGPVPWWAATRARVTPDVVVRVATGAALASYGVYLWHQWVTTEWFERRALTEFVAPFATTLAAVVVISGALAGLTYWFVERPASTLLTGRGGGTPAPEARRLGRHRELDGLRGLSILAVLATHVVFLNAGDDAWSLTGGFLGVDVFLALSGFLIGAVLLREVDRDGTVDGRDFARRRARRLLPPLAVFLVVQATVAVLWLDSALREQLLQAVLALTFTSNWQLSFGHQPPFPLVPLWSLSVEGQFYVLMALGIWLARRRLQRPQRAVAALLLASVGVALWRTHLYQRGIDLPALYERTDARADSMFLGVAAAVVWRSRLASDRTIRMVGAAGLAVLAVCSVVAEPDSWWLFQGGFTVIAAAAAAAVAAAATGAGAAAWIGDVRVLRWFGGISYSLYLWHLPVYLWVVEAMPDAALGLKVLFSVPAAVLMGWLSFRLVESRVLEPWRRGAVSLRRGGDAAQEQNEAAELTR